MRSFTLNPKFRYSKGERRAFDTLSGIKRDTNALTTDFYIGRRKPGHGRIIVIGTLKGLAVKLKKNKEPFRVMRSKQNGPWPIEFWLEKA